MNNSINILSKRILPASLSALAVLLLVSCADESTPASADKLPAEVRFTAALGAPLTRATTSGVWETGELVAVEIGSERKQYVVRTADGTMSGNGEANTYYWMTPNDAPKNVTAWHLGQWNGAEAAQLDMACPGTFSVSTDQTAGTAASDFVYAPLQTISFGGTYGSTSNRGISASCSSVRMPTRWLLGATSLHRQAAARCLERGTPRREPREWCRRAAWHLRERKAIRSATSVSCCRRTARASRLSP